jgi:type IV pilus assembly protein PilC
MKDYEYTAVNRIGEKITEIITATDSDEAIRILSERRLRVLTIKAKKETELPGKGTQARGVMKKFEYTAETAEGARLIDQIIAAGTSDAVKLLAERKLRVVTIRVIKEQVIPGTETNLERLKDRISIYSKRLQAAFGLDRISEKVNDYTLLVFTQQLSVILDAGVPIMQGLRFILATETSANFKKIVTCLMQSIDSGHSASQAFACFPGVFTDPFRALVSVGESTGRLSETLRKQAKDLEKSYSFKKRTIAILTYPAVILLVSLLSVFFIMIYFIPNFTGLFKETGTKLPWMTNLLIFIVKYATSPTFWVGVAIAMIIIYYLLHSYVRTPIGRRHFDAKILRVPIIGEIVRTMYIYNAFLNISCMLECGVHIVDAMKVMYESSRNLLFKDFFDATLGEMSKGEEFSTAIADAWFIPKYAVDLAKVGEMAGELPYMLRKAGEMMEDRITFRLETMLNVFEPMIISALAGIMGFIMIAVFLPMYNAINTFAP